MSQFSQNTYTFVKSTFGPKIAVVSSDAAENISLQNGLSLVELLKPFSQLNTEFQIRDPTNTPHVIKGLHLSFSNPFKTGESPQFFRKILNDEISSNYVPGKGGVDIKGYHIKQSCPWYETFRDMYFQSFKSQEHDSIMHYLACVIFVSATEEDPIGKFQEVRAEIQKASIKWVEPDVLYYHVLIHDLNKAPKLSCEVLMQGISTVYGPAMCHLLKLHEKSTGEGNEPPGPNPWRQFAKDRTNREAEGDAEKLTLLQMAINDDVECDPLGAQSADNADTADTEHFPNPSDNTDKQCGDKLTISDQSSIRTCINDFVVRGLLPFNERRMRALNEALNGRRGLRGTFFSATKKLFSTGPKPGVSGGKMTSTAGYLSDSPENLLRRLGDISFLLQHYTMAYNSYHNVKRDFQNDQAYNHYAAALEMTSLSLFMGTGVRREPHPYYDECINVYMNLCKSPQYAMRATLVHCECLISRGYYPSAASWFIKMTNDEADLHSGLLLEQGAHCYVRMDPPSLRKYAFHLVLAGHRYSKAGQRKHALRCYQNSWDIFKGKGWSLADNHIAFTIGRHSYNIRDIEAAYEAYRALLTDDTSAGRVTHSQLLFQKGIQDFVSVVQIYLDKAGPGKTVELPSPVIDHNNIHVTLFGEKGAGVADRIPVIDKEKHKKLLQLEQNTNDVMNTSILFKSHQVVFNGSTVNISRPISAVNETVTVLLPLKNTLQIPITLYKLSLHCLHSPRDPLDHVKSTKTPSRGSSPDMSFRTKQRSATIQEVESSELEELTIEGEQEVVISLSVTPLVEGNLTISGLNYYLVAGKASGSEAGIKSGVSSIDRKSSNPDMKLAAETSVGKESVTENIVPGRITLKPVGPRLNNTKEQRCSKMYGMDNRLNLLVTSPLPRVKVNTDTIPTHLFCGEVKCGVMEVTNIGSTPLTNLCLATSHPSMIAIGQVKYESFQPVIHPIGGNYITVMRALPTSEPSTRLPGVVLQPGQTAYVAVWVYGGRVSDTVDLNILLYYTPVDCVPGVSHRVVSSEIKININVSVTVESKVSSMRPKDNNVMEMIGSVIVNNIGYFSLTLQDLVVRQIGLISDRWVLNELDINIPLVVYPGASINIPFRAQLTDKQDSYISSISLDGSPLIDISQDHVLQLYRRSPACREIHPTEDVNQGFNNHAISSLDDPSKYKMGMIIFWEGSVASEGGVTRTLHAQHHTSLEARLSQDKSQLLSLGLTYKETWKTDFTARPLLKVKVTLHVTNCHDTRVDVIVTANTTAGILAADKPKQADTLPFMWTGLTKHKLEIQDHGTSSIDLTAVFTQPGVYNINQLSVDVVSPLTALLLPHSLSSPALLRVDAL